MSELIYIQEARRKKPEPTVHPLLKKSFAFVPSAGMRLAPEMLVLELMRETFFENRYEESGKRQDLAPDALNTEEQKAVLYALRGRRKEGKKDQPEYFFAPAYPSIARFGWQRKEQERVIHKFLLSGPIAQCLWNKGRTADGQRRQKEVACAISDALLGKKSLLNEESPRGKDILSATLGTDGFNDELRALSLDLIKEKTELSGTVMRVSEDDELATRIMRDFLSICEVEGKIPRIQWLQLLMTFLRFSLPMWLLAQMRITSLLHSWLLKAVDKENIVGAKEINEQLSERNRRLLRPTLTATSELTKHVKVYMKHRVEINILLYCLQEIIPNEVIGKGLVREGAGSEKMTIEYLLVRARDSKEDISNLNRFQEVANGEDISIQRFLTREGELFSAWRNPLMRGQGKNIDEFLRVLYGAADRGEEEGGYLVKPEGRGVKRGFRVFPGQLLLKTAAYLAAKNKRHREAGRLMLQDVEELFGQYGIDFSAAADARPLLVKHLQAMGLLRGSPDAGSSVAVARPY